MGKNTSENTGKGPRKSMVFEATHKKLVKMDAYKVKWNRMDHHFPEQVQVTQTMYMFDTRIGVIKYLRCSMYGIFTYIYHINDPNVGKYSSTMEHMGFKHTVQITGVS